MLEMIPTNTLMPRNIAIKSELHLAIVVSNSVGMRIQGEIFPIWCGISSMSYTDSSPCETSLRSHQADLIQSIGCYFSSTNTIL